MSHPRRLPIGAEPLPDGGTHFRVWAPRARRVEVVFEGGSAPATALAPEDGGYFSGAVAAATAGVRYGYRLDGVATAYPDPASRFQPEGPHGPSEVVDPSAFSWTDGGWRGVTLEGQVVYEMHIGTFTRAGTWAAAEAELSKLAALGVTVIEVMPTSGAISLTPAPEPLLAPPEGRQWTLLWSSEKPRYGGHGTAPVDSDDKWRIPGEAAVVLWPRPSGSRPTPNAHR